MTTGTPPSPDVAALVRQLWPTDADDSTTYVTWGGEPALSGYRVAERYLVIPDARRARFLVPARPRSATVSSLVSYNRLRSPRTRAARSAAALILGAGLHRRLRGDVLTVWVRSEVAASVAADHLLVHRLGQQLGVPGVVAAVGVHAPDPNHKPTLQLFAPSGRPVGYAKVGWNHGTRQLIRTEAESLAAIETTSFDGLHVPRLRWAGRWNDHDIAVVEPLPRGVRRYGGTSPPGAAITAQVVGAIDSIELARSNWWIGVRRQLERPPDDDEEARFIGALSQYADRLEEAMGAACVALGRWHGDWVPWNLACMRRQLFAFDWEHSCAGVPVGFDDVHWAFQVELVLRGRDLTAAVAAADAAASRGWPVLGVPASSGPLVASCYLLEMALRTLRLKADGGSWNARLHPQLGDALRARPIRRP